MRGQPPDHVKVFATADAVNRRLEQNDPEGVAFEYEAKEYPIGALMDLIGRHYVW